MSDKAEASSALTLRAALIIGGICVLLWILSSLVLLIFTAILVAVLLRGVANTLSRFTGLPVRASLAIVSLLIVLAIAGFGFLVGPRFVNEGQQLVSEMYAFLGHMRQEYGQTSWGRSISHMLSTGNGMNFGPMAPKLLTATFGTIGGLVLMLITALYFAVSPELYTKGAARLVPLYYRARAMQIMFETGRTLRWWMLGQLIDMAVVGVLSTTGLLLLHVPLPIALGIIAGLLTFIPYLGAILAGIPAIIVASTIGLSTVLWVMGLYLVCHLVEGYLVAPLVTRRMVHLPPALTVLAMSILAAIYGFFGVLIATPLTAAIIVFIREIYVRDMLGDDPPTLQKK